MKRLCLQIQPGLSPSLDLEAALTRLQSLVSAKVTRGDDDGSYVNLLFADVDLPPLWEHVGSLIAADPDLAACTIATCEGDWAWSDFRILHHFDPEVPLDVLESPRTDT